MSDTGNAGVIAIISAAVGGILTFAGAFLNSRTQYKTAEIKAAVDKEMDENRRRDAAQLANIELRRVKLEGIYRLIAEIGVVCSLTQVQLEREKGYNLADYEKSWNELRSGLFSIVADSAIHFPDLIEVVQILSSQVEEFRFEVLYLLQVDHTDPNQKENWQQRYLDIMKNVREIKSTVINIQIRVIGVARHKSQRL